MLIPKKYYVNVLTAPDLVHVIHTELCEDLSSPPYRRPIGSFTNSKLALKEAKEQNPTYRSAICKKCCSK